MTYVYFYFNDDAHSLDYPSPNETVFVSERILTLRMPACARNRNITNERFRHSPVNRQLVLFFLVTLSGIFKTFLLKSNKRHTEVDRKSRVPTKLLLSQLYRGSKIAI